MFLHFESRDPDGARLRELAIGRLRFALRRLGWLVPRGRVSMADVNGPRGGVDKRCRIELQTRSTGTVVITALARDWRDALDAAVQRSVHALLRAWRRERAAARGSERGERRRAPWRRAPAGQALP